MTLLLQFWPYILGGLGVMFAAWRIFAAGQISEKAKTLNAERTAIDVANQIESDPLPAKIAREELRKWGR